MKFSILIANYNNGKFFKSCYESLLHQTYQNWEAIIVDDCSTDDSVETIRNIIGKDQRFSIFENDKNYGVGVTKSKLIELSDGQFFGFVDPDDAITPNAIHSSVKAFIKNQDVVLTYSKFIRCDENLTPINIPKLTRQVRNNDQYFFNCPVQIVNFTAFRKTAYEETTKIDPTLRIAEDQDLYLKLYEKGKFKFINEANYFYRIHGGGISQNSNKEKSKEYFAKVIFNAMKRRKLQIINGKKIPDQYDAPSDIYTLLEYKHSRLYRLKNRIHVYIELLRGL